MRRAGNGPSAESPILISRGTLVHFGGNGRVFFILSLKQQDQFTREALSRSQVAVLAVLMLIAHWPEDSTILIGELTDFANRFISKNCRS